VRLGGGGLTADLRHWINDGLMTFFFFVVGLEARREFDMGDLRERRRVMLPIVAGLGGMGLAVSIFLAFNLGRSSAGGWGVAMSTDTAFALGMLALVGPRFSSRLRAFVVTVLVVDDLVSLVVIATAYTHSLRAGALAIGVALFAVMLVLRQANVRRLGAYGLLGVATWVAVRQSGVDPVIVGLAMGLVSYAYPASRGDLERASDLFRLFREQPTPELARSARLGVDLVLSPNDRLQQRLHPWSSYVFVPLFALANAGIAVNGHVLSRAFSGPITLGIVIGLVAGKPLGALAASALARWLSRGRLRLPVGWGSAAGTGAVAGIAFTVSLLIASRAFHGTQLQDAKLGILTAAVVSALLAWLVFRAIALLPHRQRVVLTLGTADEVVDLDLPVDPDHDHIRGPEDAPVTLVEYGDFECPYCGQAEPIVRELLSDFGDVRYIWRHLPLSDVHPNAQLAAEAAEAAAAQGRFWEMHDLLFQHQDALRPPDLVRYAEELGLDVDRFKDDLRRHVHAGRVARDIESADLSGVAGTPTFFVNGRRHHGAYDIDTLSAAVRAAGAKALVAR